jgi:hypothetical protein
VVVYNLDMETTTQETTMTDMHLFEVTMLVAIPNYGGKPEAICARDYLPAEVEAASEFRILDWDEKTMRIVEAV